MIYHVTSLYALNNPCKAVKVVNPLVHMLIVQSCKLLTAKYMLQNLIGKLQE